MTTGRDRSPPYAALPRSTRRVLNAIETSIGDRDCAAVSYTDFMFTWHVGRRNVSRSIKLLDALGFVKIAEGRRGGNVYSLSERWRSVAEDENERRVALAQRRRSNGWWRGVRAVPPLPKPFPPMDVRFLEL